MMLNVLLLLLVITLTIQSICFIFQNGFACPDETRSNNSVQSRNTNQIMTNEKDYLLISTRSNSLITDLFNSNTFANSTLGFSIDYPFDWSYKISGNDVIFRPATELTPIFQESVKVSTGNNYSTYVIEPYLNFDRDAQQDLINNGSKLVVTPIIVSGQPAIKSQFISLRMQEGPCPPPFPGQQNITNIYVTNGKTLFTIEYKSGIGSGTVPAAEKMIDSFKIIKRIDR